MKQHGLTLLELLVTLVIASMVLALLMQMLDQGRQLEARMQGVSESATAAPWRMSLLRDAIQALLPGAEQEAGAFRGDAMGFSGATLAAPDAEGPTAKLLRVRLLNQPDGQRLQVDLDPPNTALVIAQWPTRDGYLRYLDAQGASHAQWPPQNPQRFQALPLAVLVHEGQAPGTSVHVLPIVASPVPPPTLRQLESL